MRPFAAKNPDLTSTVCALIEYERTEFAIRARKTLTCEGENQLKVKVGHIHLTAMKKTELFIGMNRNGNIE